MMSCELRPLAVVCSLVLLAIMLPACRGGPATQNAQPPEIAQTALPGTGPVLQLPPPSQLKVSSFSEIGLFREAAGIGAFLPSQNVTTEATSAHFSPSWEANADGVAALAYASYGFDLSGYDRDETIHFAWDASFGFAEAWIGLANFTTDSWQWLPMLESGPATPSQGFGELTGSGDVLVVLPVFMGTDTWELASIRIGVEVAPSINGVSPTSGPAGEWLRIYEGFSGSWPVDYAWDFGGGGTPDTSDQPSPGITLGAAGEYDCSLTMTNAAGSDTFDFTLTVEADPT